MPVEDQRLSVQTRRHPRGWVLVPIRVGDLVPFDFVLNTGFVISAISTSTYDVVAALGHLQEADGKLFWLRSLALAGQSVEGLQVRRSRVVRLLGVEGILGLNFLQQFRDVQFNIPSGMLTLQR